MSENLELEPKKFLARGEADFFVNFGIARNYVRSAADSHEKQWRYIDAVEEHLEGKKPMSQAELSRLGMDWAYNFNYHRARGKIERSVSETVAKINNSVSMGYPEFRNSKKEDEEDTVLSFLVDYNMRGVVASAIGCAFAEMMDRVGGINTFLNKTEYLAYTFGYCPILWPMNDWKGDPIHIRNFAGRPGAEIEDLNEWVVFKTEQAQWLFRQYDRVKSLQPTEEDGEKYQGFWNIEALEKVLVKLYKGKIEKDNQERRPETWAEIQDLYDKCPSNIVANSSDIRLAKIYYLELDGRITELYIPWNEEFYTQKEATNGEADAEPYILYKRKHPASLGSRDILNFIRDSGFTVTGEIAKMRGMGRIAVEDSIRYNRMRNTIGNKSLFSGAPWFQQSSTQSGEKFRVVFSQGFLSMSPGADFIERQPQFNISEHIGLLGFEEREFSENAKQYDPSASSKLSSRPTKDEVQLAQMEANQSKTAKDAVKISDYSQIFGNFIKRMAFTAMDRNAPNYKGQRLFFDLVKRYIPDYAKEDEDVIKILKSVESYSISMVLNDASALMLMINMAETPYARNRARRMLMIANGFSRRDIDIAIPLYTDKYRSMQDDRIAAIENDMLSTTNEVIFQETDDDIVHLDSHYGKLDRITEGVRTGALDIIIGYKWFLNILSHAQLHLDSMSSDPTMETKAEQYIGRARQYSQTLQQLAYGANKKMEEQAQAEFRQSQISPKDQAAIQRDDATAAANTQRKDAQAAVRAQQKQEEIQLKHDQRMVEIQGDLELDRLEAVLKANQPKA